MSHVRVVFACVCLAMLAVSGLAAHMEGVDVYAVPDDVKKAEDAIETARMNAIAAKTLYDDTKRTFSGTKTKTAVVDKEVDHLKFAVSIHERDLAALKKRIEDSLAGIEDIKTEIGTITKEVNTLKESVPAWDAEKARLTKALTELESVGTAAINTTLVLPLKARLDAIEKDRARLQQRSDDLLAKNEELKQVVAESDALVKKDKPAAEAKLKAAQDDLNKILDRKEAAVQSDTSAGASTTDTQGRYFTARIKLTEAVNHLKQVLRKHIIRRKKTEEDLGIKKDDAATALEDKKHKASALEKSIKEIQSDIERYESRMEEVTNKHRALVADITKATHKHSDLSSQHTDAKLLLDALTHRQSKLDGDVVHYRKSNLMASAKQLFRFAASETSELAEAASSEATEDSESASLGDDDDEAMFLEFDDDAVFLEEEEDDETEGAAESSEDDESASFVQEDDDATSNEAADEQEEDSNSAEDSTENDA